MKNRKCQPGNLEWLSLRVIKVKEVAVVTVVANEAEAVEEIDERPRQL